MQRAGDAKSDVPPSAAALKVGCSQNAVIPQAQVLLMSTMQRIFDAGPSAPLTVLKAHLRGAFKALL